MGKLIRLLMKILISELETGREKFEIGDRTEGSNDRLWSNEKAVSSEIGKREREETGVFPSKTFPFPTLIDLFFVNGGFSPDWDNVSCQMRKLCRNKIDLKKANVGFLIHFINF